MDSIDNDSACDCTNSDGTTADGTSFIADLSHLSLSEHNGPPTVVHDQAGDGLDEDFDTVLDDPDKSFLDLTPRACSYCDIHSPAFLVRCLICSKWFCNSRRNTSASHIVNHLLRAKHEEAILYSKSSPGKTTPECYKCGNKRVPKLGFMLIPDKDDTAAVLLCRPPCPPKYKNICLNLSLWAPLNKENPLLTWSSASSSEVEQLGSHQISFAQMDRLEDLWRNSQPNQTTPKTELRPRRKPVPEYNSSDVGDGRKALQSQLDKALAELRDIRAENKRLTNENQSQKSLIASILIKEENGWQHRLNSMQHKLTVAERQLRCLDHLTRYKLESRQDSVYGQPKRQRQSLASTDVIKAMCSLNEEIYQACVQLAVQGLDKSKHSNKYKSQAQKMFGDHLTAMMEDQATKTRPGYDVLLMQSVLQVFMVHWCSSIIEAFYPKQESFADLLVQLSAQTPRTSDIGSPAICGKQIRIVQPRNTDKDKFDNWVEDIIEALESFLKLAGMRLKSRHAHLFVITTLALVKEAYDLRTAMAERDTCGGLEVIIVAPDTPFQEKWMMNAYPRKDDINQSNCVDFVAGTIGIGLQRKVLEKVNGQFQSRMKTELKPKVVLERTLNIKANRLDSPGYLTGHVYAEGHLHIWRLRNE